ncbi:TPA: hypothetical protein ACF61S_004671, partial [Salmonella enterica]
EIVFNFLRSVLQACLGRLAERCRCFAVLPGTLPANHSCLSSVSGNPIREQLAVERPGMP